MFRLAFGLLVNGDVKECAVLVVSGSAQRRVLSMRPSPVHRQWVASVCEETTAVILVVDGCEQGAGMRREKTKWARRTATETRGRDAGGRKERAMAMAIVWLCVCAWVRSCVCSVE
jgi:hypothetical protein